MGWRWKKERLETQDIKTYVAPVTLHIVNSFFSFGCVNFQGLRLWSTLLKRERDIPVETKWDIFFLGEMFQNRAISEQVQMYEKMGNINIGGEGITAD